MLVVAVMTTGNLHLLDLILELVKVTDTFECSFHFQKAVSEHTHIERICHRGLNMQTICIHVNTLTLVQRHES